MCTKTCQILIYAIFLNEVLCISTAEKQNIYHLPLIRKKSLLEEIIKTDLHEVKNINYDKITPTNETISLFKYLDSEYYAEILVGKPGQKFNMIFDTTWADMWIPSKLCSKTLFPICGTKNLYDSNSSSTHKSIDPKPFEVAGLVGNLTCDTVRLAHLNVTDLIFAEIKEIPNTTTYQFMHADGIIGLGYNTLARTTDTPFFYKLLAEKKIAKPVFSLYMNRDSTTGKGGSIFLGGSQSKHMKGEMIFLPVTKKQYWQIEMNQFSVQLNKTSTKTFCKPSCQVILDTSTNKIGVPAEYVLAINDLIDATEYYYDRYTVPCSQIKKLPTITLNFGGRDFQIGGRHYVQKMENGTNGMICMSAFCNSGLPDGLWSLGGGFLSSVYTTFDLENNRVGIANSRT